MQNTEAYLGVVAYVSTLIESGFEAFRFFSIVYNNTDRKPLLGRTRRSRFLLELFNKQVPLQSLFVEYFYN